MEHLQNILIFTIIVIIVIFFAMREINNWYWKITERLDEQKKTNKLLEDISKKLGNDIAKNEVPEKIDLTNNDDKSKFIR